MEKKSLCVFTSCLSLLELLPSPASSLAPDCVLYAPPIFPLLVDTERREKLTPSLLKSPHSPKAFPYKPFFDANVESRIQQLPDSDMRTVDDAQDSGNGYAGHKAGQMRPRRRPAGDLGYRADSAEVRKPVDFRSHVASRIDSHPPEAYKTLKAEHKSEFPPFQPTLLGPFPL
jgi:hypothetical protein